MKYVSTRGKAPSLDFADVLLAGLATDGGLYMPESWPQMSAAELRALRGLSYDEMAFRVTWPFVEGSLSESEYRRILRESYATFEHEAVVPLVQLESNLWLMELFHGPTLAFKDVALQLLGRLFDAVLAARGERVTIVGATSGDTGSAAIEACRGREQIDIFIMHPEGRTSDVQRRQMTTVHADNVFNIALKGTFDDCQDMVKALFNDPAARKDLRLSAVNSINWARVMAQIVYYVSGAVALGAPDRPVSFSVPTGNFGNILAGYGAARMGLPVEQLICGSNSNDILTRFFETGEMKMETVQPTYSPSMDIQVSSNFERLLFEVMGRDGQAVAEVLTAFRQSGRFEVTPEELAGLLERFSGYRLDDSETLEEMRRIHAASGEIVDPHSAIGIAAAREKRSDPAVPVIALATAHPAKFPQAVEEALGFKAPLPDRVGDLYERQERFEVLENDQGAVEGFIRTRARAGKGA